MKSKTTMKRVYLPALIGIIVLSVAFRMAALFTDYNAKTGFFDAKTLINIASVIITAGSVFMFTYAFSGSKNTKLIADFSTPATYVPTGALTVAMFFFAALTAVMKRATGFSILKLFSRSDLTLNLIIKYISSNMASFLLSMMAPLACLSVGYFILNACVLERASRLRAFFGITNVLFLAFYASYLYFDTATLARNAPNKIVDQMAFIFAALFFLYEIRISLGRERWNLYIAFGFIAAVLTAYSSVPSIIVYFVNGTVISNNIQENVLTLGLFVFILSRIILAASLKEDKENESVALMREFAKERNDYIKEKEEAEKRAYMELYAQLEELEEEENSSEEGFEEEPTQISFDDDIASVPAEYAENEYSETFELSEFSENEAQTVEQSAQAPEFIQESMVFPVADTANSDAIYTAQSDAETAEAEYTESEEEIVENSADLSSEAANAKTEASSSEAEAANGNTDI